MIDMRPHKGGGSFRGRGRRGGRRGGGRGGFRGGFGRGRGGSFYGDEGSSQKVTDYKLAAEENQESGKEESRSSGNDDDFSNNMNDSTIAYQALLESLQARGGSFALAYAQRQKEEQGISTSDDEDADLRSEEGRDDVSEDYFASVEGERDEEGEISERDLDQVHVVEERKKEIYNCPRETKERSIGPQMHKKQRLNYLDSDSEKENEENGSTLDTSTDAFKVHLEHILADEDVAMLLERKTKFMVETSAAGVQEAKWVTSASEFPMEDKILSTYGVKLRLRNHWKSLHGDSTWGDFQSQQQCQFFGFCNSYQDILHTRRLAFYMGAEEEDAQIMNAYLLHILNHILKTRDLVIKNNERLSHQLANGAAANDYESPTPRDQGFTRPKVLVLLPFRSIALRVVKGLLELVPPRQKVNVEYMDRFLNEFGVEEDASVNGDVDAQNLFSENPVALNMQEKEKAPVKPADFQALFRGNNDDHFRFGIKFTRKSVKLYSDFYSSDIIIASPLGLITRIGEAEVEREKDVDFLSSIELLVIDYADVILMQNWSHVNSIVELLNTIPTQQHGTDFMRIREWFLNGQGCYYRQSIILSPFADPGINALFHRNFVNFAGKLKLLCEYSGVLSKVLLQVRQVYERIDCSTLAEVDDTRFDFFSKQIFPQLKDSLQGGIMIFINSYFDFVRLRNFLKAQNASFCLLGEYTKPSDISRARAWFFHEKRHFLLYTERAHFFHRYKIRGIKTLIFYSLPDHADFYAEMVNMLEGVENPSSIVLFSHFDKLQLERVVGTSRADKLLNSKSRLFMFC